jgi:hypothetical protein
MHAWAAWLEEFKTTPQSQMRWIWSEVPPDTLAEYLLWSRMVVVPKHVVPKCVSVVSTLYCIFHWPV